MIYQNTYTIGLEDVGLDAFATNKAVMAIMEDIGALHSASVGFGLADVEEKKQVWVVLDWKVQIIKRPKYQQKITATTWSRKHNAVCAYRDFELFNEQGEKVAIGTSRWVLMDIENRKPLRLKEEIIGLYQGEAERSAFPDEMKNLSYSKDFFDSQPEYSQKYKVLRRDIDTNLHMHNLSYLDAAYEILPQEIYNQGERNNIRISYKKEILYGEDIIGNYKNKQQKDVVCFKDVEGTIRAVVELM